MSLLSPKIFYGRRQSLSNQHGSITIIIQQWAPKCTYIHPLPLKNNIPFGQIFRIKRICSEALEFLRNCTKIICRFIQRGYPEPITQEAYYKITSMQKNPFPNQRKERSQRIHQKSQMVLITECLSQLLTERA